MNFDFYIHKTTVLPFNGGHSVCHHPIVKGLSTAPATGTGTDKWQLFPNCCEYPNRAQCYKTF